MSESFEGKKSITRYVDSPEVDTFEPMILALCLMMSHGIHIPISKEVCMLMRGSLLLKFQSL